MGSNPSQAGSRKARTRERLLQAAAEMVAERGFGAVSLMDVAERARLTTGAVYSNFRSKEALLLAVMEAELDRMTANPPRSQAEGLETAREAGTLLDDARIYDGRRPQ